MNCRPDWIAPHLNETLAENESTWLVSHLSRCSDCQQALYQLSGGQTAESSVANLIGSSKEVSSATQFSFREQLETPSGMRTRERQDILDSRIRDIACKFPFHPSDDPNSMGRIGGHEVVGVIGCGGMGIVYKAFDKALHRHIAIKVLAPHMSSSGAARKRFQLEARAMASIAHEHVVPVYAVDEHQDIPYFEMEYVAGGTLESRIRELGPLDCVSVLRIARQTALALAAAHECGMVHRDI
jgi:eukaryotic-like serine/threonine-protein kinase